MEGVREQLNLGLLRYSEDLDGVMLSYSGERITSSHARLHPYFPFLAVTVTANVTLFCPRPGQQLVGRVIKVGADYIGLLVMGVFNAAIGADRIRREFQCSHESGSWLSLKNSRHRISVGSYVRFTVDSVLDQASLFSIMGSLQDPGTGEEQHCKKRGGGGEVTGQAKGQHEQQQNGMEPGAGKKRDEKKKKKKRKETENGKDMKEQGKKDKSRNSADAAAGKAKRQKSS